MSLENNYPELFTVLKQVVPKSVKVYLVGGAVRDELIGYAINDFDFVSEGLVRPIGKKLANEMNGRYYVLDDDREMVRVIVNFGHDYAYNIDIAQLSASDIEGDLRERDFTINAIALEFLEREKIIDPLGGVADLRKKRLRMCSLHSLQDDPLRAVRAIRLALEYNLKMDEELLSAMHLIRPELPKCSYERYRDELIKTLRAGKTNIALELYQRFDFLDFLFPNFPVEKVDEAISITVRTEELMSMITQSFTEEKADNLYVGYTVLQCGDYRNEITHFFDENIILYHSRRLMMSFCAILLPVCYESKARMSEKWMKTLVFSREEIEFVDDSHKAFLSLLVRDKKDAWTDVDTYKYFKKYRIGAIPGGILYLAKVLTQPESQDKFENVKHAANLLHAFCDASFRRYKEVVKPDALLSGDDICELLHIPACQLVGKIKDALIEQQILGNVTDVEQAKVFCLSCRMNE